MKNNRSVIWGFLVVVALSAVLMASSGKIFEGSEAKKLRFSLSQAITEPTVIAAGAFKEEVERRTNGAIVVEIYADNQIGNERDSVEGLLLGTVGIAAPANALITNFIEEFSLFSLPMLFENKAHVYNALDTIGMSYASLCEEKGFKLLGWFDLGSRNIMTVSKEVSDIQALSGLKIRTQESPVEMDGMSSFGCTATPMSYNELYTALSSSVIDGAEAANTNYVMKAFYEVAPNWAIVGWLECVNPVLMCLEIWNDLSEEHKVIITEAAKNMVDLERKLYAQSEDDCLEVLKQKNVNITYPDRQPFKEAANKIYKQYAGMLGGMDRIEAVINSNILQ